MRVLVVEDARALAEVVAEGLRDQGMAVDIAFDGLEAAAELDASPELVLRVRALARRRPQARPRTLQAAGVELDPVRRTVTREGLPVDLSAREFSLLEALPDAGPAFLSAEDLLERVWDEHADPFTNTVAVTISRLRRNLGCPQVITTTPGVGYRIAG
ncbi:response regulator transcription factor [Streptomyces sp. NBC_00354]|uniref:response regulator transcription factor n=1 Tax=Streptomyces sp. NBC_00354 TaxID=2975723 RepID=UPI002E26A8B6|nr:DNA-binding response regulator [Streptomyces sp. NBC_01001]